MCIHERIALFQGNLFLLAPCRLSDRDHQLVRVKNASEQMRAQLSSKEESLSRLQAECSQLSQQLETLQYADTVQVINFLLLLVSTLIAFLLTQVSDVLCFRGK